MNHEFLPGGFVAGETQAKPIPEAKPISEARLAANRANAIRSTGPRTDEGKARSRGNALKHGQCATVVEVPGEDPAIASGRLAAWSASLNPDDDPVVGYLTEHAVRASIRLDRCHLAHEATVAGLARAARDERHQARMARVEEASARITEAPDAAGRVLRSMSEGCDFLIGELERIKLPLMPEPPLWDHEDALRLLRLMGLAAAARGEGPSPLGLVVIVLAEYRALVEKLRINERPLDIPWNRRYPSPEAHQADLERLPEMTRKARTARDEVAAAIDSEIAHLMSLRDRHLTSEAADADEAPVRALFDASDAGRLLHRYEQETHRALLRSLKEAREIKRSPRPASCPVPAPVSPNERTATAGTPRCPGTPARNEPKPLPLPPTRTSRSKTDCADSPARPDRTGPDRSPSNRR